MKEHAHNPNVRNIAIIAHVDHGKTTLVDQLFRQSGTFRENQDVAERVMDNMDLERERGITIAAKNCAVNWKDVKINILDTPGHADFSGEVERALMMVDGAILLVDAAEGPLPQTRFVLRKALEAKHSLIIVINKIDRKDARPMEVLDEVYQLLMDLDAPTLEIPVFYAVGRDGIASSSLTVPGVNIHPLLDAILTDIPAPSYDAAEPLQMLVCDIDYSEYVGRLAIGKVMHGTAKKNESLVCIDETGTPKPLRVSKLQTYSGISLSETDSVCAGDIIILAGMDEVTIGDTICTAANPKALKRIVVDEPTVSMEFSINTSPFSGREGRFVQGAKIRERLTKETLGNVGIKVEFPTDRETFIVKGRGELQMAVLIETMRREGYEVSVARPKVILKTKDGKTQEPIEHLFVDCAEEFVGAVTEKLSRRKGRMTNLINHGSGRVRIEFSIPARSLIGYRSEFLTDTRGTGIMNTYLMGYEDYRGDYPTRLNGSLVSDRVGKATPYAVFNLEPRGNMFIIPGEEVYEGMIVGEHNRENDLVVNIVREKKMTNVRSVGHDENVILTPVQTMTLERAMAFIGDDELVEITPKCIRLRKTILESQRRNAKTADGERLSQLNKN